MCRAHRNSTEDIEAIRRSTFIDDLADALFLRRRERLFGVAGHYAATCELAWGRTGMSLALRGTRIFFARSSSTATRQRGTKPERFQLCTVVSGMPVPFEMAVTPPSASKMSDTLSMHPNYDIRNCHARV